MRYDIDLFIDKFDKEVGSLVKEKIYYEYRLTYTELYIGTLCREMTVIRKYQYMEDNTQEKINVYLGIKGVIKFKLYIRERRIIRKEHLVDMFNDQIKNIVKEFQQMVQGSRFSKHLTKIFKKKYRPPKKTDDDSESSSSSESESSSSEDQDEEAAAEVAAYRFDENILPDGCDPHMFSRVFKFRAARHDLEAKIILAKKDIVSNQHDMVSLKRSLRVNSVLLAVYQLQMERILKEKQDDLNQVNIVLLLNPSQIQNWDTEKKDYVQPEDLVVASVTSLRELKEEKRKISSSTMTLRKQRKLHSVHKIHLKKDIRTFEEQYAKLKSQKKELLLQKFGVVTNIYAIDLESTRRLLLTKTFDSVVQEKSGIANQLKKRMYDEKNKLAALKKMHAEHLFNLAAIEEEKNQSIQKERKICNKMNNLHEYITQDQLEKDVETLQTIYDQQMILKEKLKQEIRWLKFKERPPDSKVAPPRKLPARRIMPKKKPETLEAPLEIEDTPVSETDEVCFEDEDDEDEDKEGEFAQELFDKIMKEVSEASFQEGEPHPEEEMKSPSVEIRASSKTSGMRSEVSIHSAIEELDSHAMAQEISKEIMAETLRFIIPSIEELPPPDEEPMAEGQADEVQRTETPEDTELPPQDESPIAGGPVDEVQRTETPEDTEELDQELPQGHTNEAVEKREMQDTDQHTAEYPPEETREDELSLTETLMDDEDDQDDDDDK